MKRFIVAALFAFLLGQRAYGQATPVAMSPAPWLPFISTSGAPLAGGCVYSYVSGTSTPLATFADGTGVTQSANPVILDASGFASIWLSNSSYRFSIWSFGSGAVGSNCGNGTFQRTVDNINAYSVIDQAQNIFLAGSSSDPSGTAGELAYRTDIPCFRGFTTFWDCLVRLTDTQTLTNKTLTSPTITNPTITGTVAGSPTITNPLINGVNAQVGTTYTIAVTDEQKLVTFSNVLPVAVTLPQASTLGFGSGASFHFRNLGSGIVTVTPTTSTIDGVATLVLVQNQGADVYSDGTNYETQKGTTGAFPQIVYSTNGSGCNITCNQLMVTASPSGNQYRFTMYLIETVVGTLCSGSTTLTPQVIYTDPAGSSSTTISFPVVTITNNGTLGAVTTNSTSSTFFASKASTTVTYQLSISPAGGCAPAPTIQVIPRLEQM